MPVLILANPMSHPPNMIRTATIQDLDSLMTLLEHFAESAVLEYKNWCARDHARARERMFDLIKNHYVIVAATPAGLAGMIGAQQEQDTWITQRTRLRELFWWVEPEHRHSRLSAQLFARWQTDSDKFIEQGLVNQVSLSIQPGVSQIDLGRRGWRCVEEHWIKG